MPEPDIYIDWEECPEVKRAKSLLGKIASAFRGPDNQDDTDDDNAWDCSRCLYGYFDSDFDPIYIGKAWGSTVWSRYNAQDKDNLWADVEQDLGLKPEDMIVMAGHIECRKVTRLTQQLLADLEALLIMQVRPWGNVQSRRSRKMRSGLVVECGGDWPLDARIYVDHSG